MQLSFQILLLAFCKILVCLCCECSIFTLIYQYFLDQNEVAGAIELREIVTSLGPAYIKLGQALSIRPDILSPAAMTELQKLCDKVKAFLLIPF